MDMRNELDHPINATPSLLSIMPDAVVDGEGNSMRCHFLRSKTESP